MTEADRHNFRENGYFTTPVLVQAPALATMREECARLWQRLIDDAQRRGEADEIERARFKPFIALPAESSAVCAEFIRHPKLVALAAEILGGTTDLDSSWNQIVIKPPHQGRQFSWHQDSYYAMHGDYTQYIRPDLLLGNAHAVTFWVAITETAIENGTLWVAPRRHREGLLPHAFNHEPQEWECQAELSDKQPAILAPGQVLVFTGLTPHGSGANTSDQIRIAYQISYARPEIWAERSPESKNPNRLKILRGGRFEVFA